MSETDIPTGLIFVDPSDTPTTYRVGLFAPPGAGKSVTAASAPPPILLLSADRPAAYAFARKHHGLDAQKLREVRYAGVETLEAVFRYLRSPDGKDIKTVVVDPVGNIVDSLRDVAPRRDGDPDYVWINAKMFGFVKALRQFDVHVVLVAHEKLNDGKKGDGKVYPQFGGLTLINKILGELDICAHVERLVREVEGEDEPQPVWIGQLQPVDNLVCKEATGGTLGDRRVANLTRWFEVASENLAQETADVPWSEGFAADAPALEPEAVEEPVTVLVERLQEEAFALSQQVWAESTVAKKMREAGENPVALRALVQAARHGIRAKQEREAVAS